MNYKRIIVLCYVMAIAIMPFNAIAGNIETEELSIRDTVEIYRFIDAIRYTWNLPFPLPEEPEKKPMKTESLNPETKNA